MYILILSLTNMGKIINMSDYNLLNQINRDNETTNLDINLNFTSFSTFFENSKGTIYTSMINSYIDLYDKKIKSKILLVNAKIDNQNFTTEFNISVNLPNIIVDIIIPYFEEIENYEMCDTSMKIYEKLIRLSD